MEFGVLGPVEIRVPGGVADAGHARQRCVLAVLLLNLGRVVPAGELIDRVWGQDPPASVRKVLYGYTGRLRAVIAAAGDPQVTLTRRHGGYLLQARPEQLDLGRFRRLAAQAAAGTEEDRAAALRAALGLWRGPALAGLSSPWLDGMRQALELERLAATLDLNDILLRQGQHHALVSELARQAAAHPADERLTGQLMLALYRSGRPAEALRWFDQTRRHLASELGTNPGTALSALHQQILRADPALQVSATTGLRSVPAPRELPPDVPAFTGRAAGLAELDRLLLPRPVGAKTPAVVISAIAGTPGVGKTALAVHWAHLVADQFPDGQLYVNLRGYDPAQPVSPADALAGFLRSLGVPGQDIPPEADQRTARYRSLIADKQMLVILDNAGSAGQVRPLLPGSASCAVLVTSRDALAGLVARDGAARLDLDVLPPREANALLRALIGTRAGADPAAAAELAAQCCRLPLALRVTAELAATRPAEPLAALVSELADLRTRLDRLTAGGDLSTEVRAVFSWSYRHLHADAARTFRLLGLHPGPDFEPYAAAALTSEALPQARQALDALARAHLIQPATPGRYSMHDLLRGYARSLATTDDGEDDQHAALTRLFDHCLHTSSTAMDALYPAERHRRPSIPPPATPVPVLANPAAAREWLDGERANLVAVALHTSEHGWPGHATRLAATLASYLHGGGHFPEALTIFSHALSAARRVGDRTAEATVLNHMGSVDCQQSRHQQAGEHYRRALTLFRAAGDRAGEARVLVHMGLAETDLGRYEHAARHQQEAVVIFGDIRDRHGEARALGSLGMTRRMQGRYQEAVGYYQQTLDLSREIGDREGEAWTLARLGNVDLRLGRYQRAADYHRQALALFRDMGNRVDESEVMVRLGEVYLKLGRYEQAAGRFEQALVVFREVGDRVLEADALIGLGEVLMQTDVAGKAHAHYATALRLASEAEAPLYQAHAHRGLARVCHAVGDSVQARHHWQQALTRYDAIGAPEADEIRAQLAIADNGGDSDTPSGEGDTTPLSPT
jgi:DNA-binding SARP family transcriptional activator/cytochrome c-type biogenesis protein CcmH/NrfG